MAAPTREVQTKDLEEKTPKEQTQDFEEKTLQVERAEKGQERQSKVKNTINVIAIEEEPERKHAIPTQGPQSDKKNDKGKKVDKGTNVDKRKDKLSFLPFVPRKKLPFMSNNDEGKDHCLTGSKSRSLEDALRGPLGFQAVFMPAPGHNPFRPAGRTPPISGHPFRSSPPESEKSSS